jgi:biopolymer transport protein ExbD
MQHGSARGAEPSHQVVTKDCQSLLSVDLFELRKKRYLTARINREVPVRYDVGDSAELGEKVSEAIAQVLSHDPVYLADGRIEQDRLPDAYDRQAEMIRAAVQRGKEDDDKENVLIKADRDVAYREVARVLKAASKVEGMRMHLAVLEED